MGSITMTQPYILDLEIRMANVTNPMSVNFDANISSATVVPTVVLRQQQVLVPPGNAPWRITFNQGFTWTGNHVVVEYRVYASTLPAGQVHYATQMYAVDYPAGASKAMTLQAGPVTATTGLVTASSALVTRFVFLGGVSNYYGTGCAGTNGLPFISESNAPFLQPWSIRVFNGRPNAIAALVLGGSRVWYAGQDGVRLPVSFAPGCDLLVSPDLQLSVPLDAAGSASVTVPFGTLLPVGGLASQWVILDSGAANGSLAASDAMWTIFG